MEFPLRTLALPFVATLALAAACASGGSGSGTRNRACDLRPTDSAFARAGPVYRACAVDREANLRTRTVRLDYTPLGPTGCFAAEIEFVVDTAGMVEMSTVRVASTNEPALARAMIAALRQFRYTPAQLGGVAVRQIATEQRKFHSEIVSAPVGAPIQRSSGSPPC